MNHISRGTKYFSILVIVGMMVLAVVISMCSDGTLSEAEREQIIKQHNSNLTPTDSDGDGVNDWIETSDRENTLTKDDVNFNIGLGETEQYEDMFKDDDFSDTEKEILEEIGLDPSTVTTEITQSGGKIVGNLAKTVKSFKTLADAEEDMGYYLGFHNTIESHPELTLSGIYSIGSGEWYQALFEDETNTINNITVKTSMKTSIEELTAPYNIVDFDSISSETIYGVEVTFVGNNGNTVNLVYFDVPNGKAYTIYTSVGNEYSLMQDLVVELIGNLQIMDDWKG